MRFTRRRLWYTGSLRSKRGERGNGYVGQRGLFPDMVWRLRKRLQALCRGGMEGVGVVCVEIVGVRGRGLAGVYVFKIGVVVVVVRHGRGGGVNHGRAMAVPQ
jgi:hypothetical protein